MRRPRTHGGGGKKSARRVGIVTPVISNMGARPKVRRGRKSR